VGVVGGGVREKIINRLVQFVSKPAYQEHKLNQSGTKDWFNLSPNPAYQEHKLNQSLKPNKMKLFYSAIRKAKDEARKNREKAMHNLTCKNVDDLQPYDNTEYLNMVLIVKGLLHCQLSIGENLKGKL
jgi:hypothetical protein